MGLAVFSPRAGLILVRHPRYNRATSYRAYRGIAASSAANSARDAGPTACQQWDLSDWTCRAKGILSALHQPNAAYSNRSIRGMSN